LKAIGFTGSVSTIYEKLANSQLKLVKLLVDEIPMKDAANKSPKVLNNLESFGGDARIAHQLFVVMEAAFATSFTGATSYDVSADVAGIVSIKAKGGTSVAGKDLITLSPGTGLAYLLLDLDWNKDKTKIDGTSVDEWSIN
jgi:hypothetical protein